MKKMTLALYLILTCLLTSCITEEEESISPNLEDLKVGDTIPTFSLTLNDGSYLNSQQLLGDVSVIVFFHTSCKDCQEELPIIQRIHESYPNLKLICISRAESNSSIANYWTKHQFTLTYSAQEDRRIFELFASQIIPRIYIINAKGIIQSIFTDNPLATFEELEKAIQEAKE